MQHLQCKREGSGGQLDVRLETVPLGAAGLSEEARHELDSQEAEFEEQSLQIILKELQFQAGQAGNGAVARAACHPKSPRNAAQQSNTSPTVCDG